MLAEHRGHGIEEHAMIVAENQASHAAPFEDLHLEPGLLRRAPSFSRALRRSGLGDKPTPESYARET